MSKKLNEIEVIAELQNLMQEYPELRLGQIIANAIAPYCKEENSACLYYVTDEKMLELLQKLRKDIQ